MDAIFRIPTSVFEVFETKVKKVNKIAKKLGVTGYTVEVLGTEMSEIKVSPHAIDYLGVERDKVRSVIEERTVEDFRDPVTGKKITGWTDTEEKSTVIVEVTKIHLSGEMPVVGGYSFVGVIDPSKISRSAPGENIPAKLLKKVGSCDHCKKIRNRTMTIVVRKGKTYKVVGSACVKDFLGTSARDLEISAKNLTDYYEFFYFLERMEGGEESDWGGMGSVTPAYTLRDVLLNTYAAIKVYGWVSRSASYKTPLVATSNYVSILLNGPTKRTRNSEPTEYELVMMDLTYGTKFRPLKKGEASAWDKAEIAAEEGGLLDKAIEWAKDLGKDNSQDYLRNLSILTELESITERELGLACSMISTYEREMGRELEKAERVETFNDKWGNSVFLGEKGIKIIANVEVLRISEFVGNYGPVEIIKMGTDDGNILTWFSTSTTPEEISVIGGKATIKGTVKGTNEYKGIKETIITRVKIAA